MSSPYRSRTDTFRTLNSTSVSNPSPTFTYRNGNDTNGNASPSPNVAGAVARASDSPNPGPGPHDDKETSTIRTPQQLADLFMFSGKFDELRKELMSSFAESESKERFTKRLDEIIAFKLYSDRRLTSWKRTEAHAEVMREIERHTIYDRTLYDVCSNLLQTSPIDEGLSQLLRKTNGTGAKDEQKVGGEEDEVKGDGSGNGVGVGGESRDREREEKEEEASEEEREVEDDDGDVQQEESGEGKGSEDVRAEARVEGAEREGLEEKTRIGEPEGAAEKDEEADRTVVREPADAPDETGTPTTETKETGTPTREAGDEANMDEVTLSPVKEDPNPEETVSLPHQVGHSADPTVPSDANAVTLSSVEEDPNTEKTVSLPDPAGHSADSAAPSNTTSTLPQEAAPSSTSAGLDSTVIPTPLANTSSEPPLPIQPPPSAPSPGNQPYTIPSTSTAKTTLNPNQPNHTIAHLSAPASERQHSTQSQISGISEASDLSSLAATDDERPKESGPGAAAAADADAGAGRVDPGLLVTAPAKVDALRSDPPPSRAKMVEEEVVGDLMEVGR